MGITNSSQVIKVRCAKFYKVDSGEGLETGNQTDGYNYHYKEVEQLICILCLFYKVQELINIVAYTAEQLSWKLTNQKLLALVSEPTMLKVETFNFYHEILDDSVFSFFRRYLYIHSIRTLMVKSEHYPKGKIFRGFLLDMPSLTNLTVRADGFSKWSLEVEFPY